MLQACNACGIGFDLEKVPRNPFQRCPNAACKAPLEADAVEHTFVEAANPGNKKDPMRLDLRAQLHNDVAAVEGAETLTTTERVAQGLVANDMPDRKILRFGVESNVNGVAVNTVARRPGTRPTASGFSGFDAFRR